MFSVICASHFVGDLSQMYLIQLTKARSSGPNLPQSGTQIWQKAFQTRVKDNDKKLYIYCLYLLYTVYIQLSTVLVWSFMAFIQKIFCNLCSQKTRPVGRHVDSSYKGRNSAAVSRQSIREVPLYSENPETPRILPVCPHTLCQNRRCTTDRQYCADRMKNPADGTPYASDPRPGSVSY